MTKLKLNPNWRIKRQAEQLIINGGADAVFSIEGIEGKTIFDDINTKMRIDRKDLNQAETEILEQLLTAEIIIPEIVKSKKLNYQIINPGIKIDLNLSHKLLSQNDNPDILIIVRTNQTFSDLLAKIKYQNINKPHILLDLAYNSTISIGPLVIPGETACLACLQGRITERWGDEKPPQKPLILDYANLASELLKFQLIKYLKTETGLVNKTVSWNFEENSSQENTLYKLELCPLNH